MTRATVAGGALAIALVLLSLAGRDRASERDADATSRAPTPATAEAHQGLLYGRVTTDDGAVFEGQLRFGGDEEAFWGHYFNAVKDGNPWAAQVPPDRLKKPMRIFGLEIARWGHEIDLGRPFMARFGDLARIETSSGRDLRVILKSGTVVELNRFGADDFADGVRVWDDASGDVMELGERHIRSIEFLPTPHLKAAPARLYGTVSTRQGDFTGFVQWDRKASVGSDELVGNTADGALSLPFANIRSIARDSKGGSRVTLLDGREILLEEPREDDRVNNGTYVDDPRYGRVLVSWDAFERVDLSPASSGPAYGDFPSGRPLTGSVTTRDGRRLGGRLVYDLDESETTETLDAPSQGVDYTIPLGLIARVVRLGPDGGGPGLVKVTLQTGEELELERAGDLSERNGGLLVFVDGRERPEYVPWSDVGQIDLDGPPTT